MLDSQKNNNLDFLQSEEWRKFQESVGRRTFFISVGSFQASIIEHKLPIVGKYFYCPRGPVRMSNDDCRLSNFFDELVGLAKKENIGWIRIDPKNEEILSLIKNNTEYEIQKAPHDMQPKEIFVVDISKLEEEILSEMSQKTRYNIKLSQKKEVKIEEEGKHIEDFLKLVKATAERKGVSFHPENYYRKMLETIPDGIIKLYVAKYKDKIIAANLVVFYGDTAIYFHGATDDEYRNAMAPYLLQWQAILDAKRVGCKFYDFGGVKTGEDKEGKDWAGITKFKIGFSPQTKPVEFSGSYDIILSQRRYLLYKIIQKIRAAF